MCAAQDLPVHAVPYKLLLYEPSGHFIFHQDTEKEPGMFATLIVQLPSTFQGGALVVKNQGRINRHECAEGSEFDIKYAAHYSDCEHALEEVTSGYRLAIVYSLCLPLVRRSEACRRPCPDYL